MKIELIIDGKKIPMNAFIQKIFTNVMLAMVESLHGVGENWKEISLKVERE